MVNARGMTLRCGSVLPESEKTLAHILYVEGASEFAEKTFELARDFNRAACGFWVLDRAGLGLSERYLSNRFKQHSGNFTDEAADIIQFAREVLPQDGAPIILLGHSTGGLVALTAAHDAPEGTFAGVAATSPLLGLNRPGIIKNREHIFANLLLPCFVRESFIPGGQEWRPREDRWGDMSPEDYSGDPDRNAIHDYWPWLDKALQVGAVTMGWVVEASKAMIRARDPEWLKEIKMPVHIFTAGKDRLVNNQHTLDALPHFNDAAHTEFPDGGHDLPMERDAIRDVVISTTVNLAKRAAARKGPVL